MKKYEIIQIEIDSITLSKYIYNTHYPFDKIIDAWCGVEEKDKNTLLSNVVIQSEVNKELVELKFEVKKSNLEN